MSEQATHESDTTSGHEAHEESVLRPLFHHVNLKTTRLQEMIDWYGVVVGAEVIFRYELGAWLTNDGANHRIALLAFPGLFDDPERIPHTGLHHAAFEYGTFDELMETYARLKRAGITPFLCFDHGMTFSIYYHDPDSNAVELQVDNFGDWEKSKEWMRTSLERQNDPLGVLFDPEQVLAAKEAGMGFEEIHRRAMDGEYVPDTPPEMDVPLPQSPE